MKKFRTIKNAYKVILGGLIVFAGGIAALATQLTASSLSAIAQFIANTSTTASVYWLMHETKMPESLIKKDQ